MNWLRRMVPGSAPLMMANNTGDGFEAVPEGLTDRTFSLTLRGSLKALRDVYALAAFWH
jgi:hypothetical protein